jgi:hypothetical protein
VRFSCHHLQRHNEHLNDLISVIKQMLIPLIKITKTTPKLYWYIISKDLDYRFDAKPVLLSHVVSSYTKKIKSCGFIVRTPIISPPTEERTKRKAFVKRFPTQFDFEIFLMILNCMCKKEQIIR